MTMQLIDEYNSYLNQIGYSTSTIQSNLRVLHRFLTYAPISIENISPMHILQFYEHLKQLKNLKKPTENVSECYVYAHVSALKIFFNWLETSQQITINPISTLKFKKPIYQVRIPLTQEEIQELFSAAISLKETAILHLFYSCGLRVAEAANLQTKDIHWHENMLYVREGKGKKRRVVPITDKVSKALESYWKYERSILAIKNANEPFILGNYGLKQNNSSFDKTIKRILKRTNIARTVSPHYLRHSIATHLLSSGISLENVRQFLGHSCLETTQIYTKVNLKQYHL
jgi:integrase/recombinase XerD